MSRRFSKKEFLDFLFSIGIENVNDSYIRSLKSTEIVKFEDIAELTKRRIANFYRTKLMEGNDVVLQACLAYEE